MEHFRELYRYRLLVEALVRREVRARYRGSALGYFWTLLNPLLLVIVYGIVFTQLTRAVEIRNYAVFLFVGILPWLWLSTSLANASVSISQSGSMITRVCIPPQVLPAVAVLANLVNFLLGLPVAIAAAAIYGITPSLALLLLPIAVALQLVFLYGLSLALATLTVRFRDVQFLVQNLVMVWFFLTPIAYPLDQVPNRYRVLALANPATPFIASYQRIVFERSAPEPQQLVIASIWAIVLVAVAVKLFDGDRDTLAESV